MAFTDDIRNFIERKQGTLSNIDNEEQTKTSLIMPFFQLLGYDVFNVDEFVPEFTADVGMKKGEKVDYAIIKDGKPVILIEAKPYGTKLSKYDDQLYRYFSVTSSKFAVLTNGTNYRFFTDLDKPNVMDADPFFDIDLLDCTDSQLNELHKFHSDNFEESEIISAAEELKYLGKIKSLLKQIFNEPTDEFVKFVLNQDIYAGVKTSNVIEKYRPVVKRSLTSYINELVNTRIQSALQGEEHPATVEEPPIAESLPVEEEPDPKDLIVTTQEELECYYIVKSILRNDIDVSRLSYKDTRSYFGILVDGKVTRWVCRVFIRDRTKFITIPGEGNAKEERIDINSPDDLYQYADVLIQKLHQVM